MLQRRGGPGRGQHVNPVARFVHAHEVGDVDAGRCALELQDRDRPPGVLRQGDLEHPGPDAADAALLNFSQREDAAAIRTAWHRADFLPEGDREEAVGLLRNYVDQRVDFVTLSTPDDDRFNYSQEELRDRVYAIACGIVHDRSTAADISQEVFMKLLTRLPQFDGGEARGRAADAGVRAAEHSDEHAADDHAPARGVVDPGDHVQQCGFAAA